MTLDDLLTAIADELDVIPDGARPSRDELRQLKAIARVFERAQRQQITPFQERIIRTLDTLSPRDDSPPVATAQLIASIGGLNARSTACYHLGLLEDKGLVERPQGPRSGWKAVSNGAD